MLSRPLRVPRLPRTPHPATAPSHLRAPRTSARRPASRPERAGVCAASGRGVGVGSSPAGSRGSEGGRRGRQAGGGRRRIRMRLCGSYAVGPPAAPGSERGRRGSGAHKPGVAPARHAPSASVLPQRPQPARGLARALVGLRVLRPRRSPAAARGGTTLPRKPCDSACLLGVVVQRGASAREAGGRGNSMSHDAARRPRGPGV